MSNTPKQIGDVVNVDRMDTIDRQKLDPTIKLQLLAAETRAHFGRDPRAGGFAFVGRPRVILQLLIDMNVGPLTHHVMLHKPIVIGITDSDLVATWEGIKIIVRSATVGDALRCVPLDQIPESLPIDRRQAGQLRINAHAGTLPRLRED